ncbi:SCL-interrupting locus protein homolog isoform X2 [Actinia tenebrosa]|uniref:SCL-interrupting locus protein homolog isoform X2 n=1 Tax=Actinia tenebrosa TaxID=6105 RepID=A0A6P8HFI0_ACTTE|nr:SCL-interrupting locus protein homolog isoform X2 [Actinia tenebrosa]
MACIQPPTNNRKPLPVISAFFPNANKEEQKSEKLPGYTKDRKPQGTSELLHLSSRRNFRLLVNEKTIRLAIKHFNQSSSPYECFLIGSISIDSREEAVDINVDRFDPGRDMIEKKGGTKRKIPTTVVPGDQIVPLTLIKGLSGADNSTTHSKKEFQRTLEILHSRISGQDTLNLSNFLSLKATCHAHVDDDEMILNLHFGAVSIVTSVVATPVSPVPIIPTALARNLTGPLKLSNVQGTPKCGFLTMDHTRKLLLLLESDPKAYSLPLIGVWVSGPFTIHHPYIWACCVRFLHSTVIQERVLASPNTFLLVHYSPAQTNPIFWECSPQVQLDKGLFELYSSYENLHLDEISSPKYTEPLCFELISAGDTMNRAVFNQAVSSWTKENENHTNENPASLESKASISNNIVNLEPRPSPLPHPQTTQSPLLLPTVPEVSLSLSFDESTFSDHNPHFNGRNQDRQVFSIEKQPIFPGRDGRRILPLKKDDQVILRRNPNKQDQENRGDPRHVGKQVLIDRTPVSSPQREPLRPITGQVNHLQNPAVRVPGIDNDVPGPKGHVVPVGKGHAQNRAVNRGHPKSSWNAPKAKGPPKKVSRDGAIYGRGRGSTIRTRESESTSLKYEVKEMQDVGNVEAQGKSVMTSHEEGRVPLVGIQDQNYPKKDKTPPRSNRSEGHNSIERNGNANNVQITYGRNIDPRVEEQHASNNNSNRVPGIEDTRMPYLVESRQENHHHHYPSDAGIDDNEESKRLTNPSQMPQINARTFHQHQPNDQGINSKHNESGMENSAFCDSGVGNSTRDTTQPDEDDDEGGISNQDAGSSCGKKDVVNETRRDPYDLIMRQQQQLKELQHQINLLLLQQSLTQNSPVGIPTPPPTPVSPDNPCVLSSPVRPRDTMVTMGTNTGASLLIGSPVLGRGKISVGTSPMREVGRNEEKRRRLRSQKRSPSSSSKTTSGSPSLTSTSQSSNHHQPDGTLPRESTPSSRESLDGTIDDDELDEKGLVLERLDETNITLASSIHGVDICEFVGSPESTRGQRRSSDSSPVLGESASMMMQQQDEQQHQQQRGIETPDEDHRFESLLYKNEKLFYDNLLFKVNQLLCENVGKSEETPNTSHDATQSSNQQEAKNEENVIHEPTRQEVLMATVKELERMKERDEADGHDDEKTKAENEYQKYNEPRFRSSLVGILQDHPHINYTSMTVDETLDETILDTETLALKYLNQEQIQEYLQLSSNRHGNQGRGPTRAPNNIGGFNNGRLINDVDCTWNNLSMATQDYLQRYNLVGCKKTTNPTRNGDGHVMGTQAPKPRDGDCHGSSTQAAELSRDGSVASIQCSAPPSTPEPRQTETRILDIQRLRNLPKLL